MSSLNTIIQEITKIDSIANIPVRFIGKPREDSLAMLTKYGDLININLNHQPDDNVCAVVTCSLPLSSNSQLKSDVLSDDPEVVVNWLKDTIPSLLTELAPW